MDTCKSHLIRTIFKELLRKNNKADDFGQKTNYLPDMVQLSGLCSFSQKFHDILKKDTSLLDTLFLKFFLSSDFLCVSPRCIITSIRLNNHFFHGLSLNLYTHTRLIQLGLLSAL